MKKVYLLIAACTLFISLEAQNFDWAKREGQSAYDYGYGITTDNSGNVYVAGKYEMNANFSGTILPCQGNHDIYVAQYSSTGTLNWIRTAGAGLGDYAHAIACDGANLYVAGEIEGTDSIIKFVGSAITLKCKSGNDAFVAKYDLSGTLLWARSAGAYQDDKALSVTYDNTGNVYVCGFFNDTAYFGSTIITGNIGENDIFVAKYDKDGNFLWVQKAGSSGRDEAKSIKCDAAGNVYVCGLYSTGCDFGTGALITSNNTSFFDSFLAKYSSAGTLQWVKTAGGDYDDVAWSLTMDNAGKIYVTGEFNAYANFGGIHLTTASQAQAFVTCYDSNGNVQWATAGGDMTASGAMVTRARGIGCDGTNLYITGQFGGTATFGATTLTAVDSSDIFIASLDNAGNFIRAIAVGGAADAFEPLGYESGNAIAADAAGNAYATGSLLDGGVFGGTTLTAYSRTDVFITKVSLMTGINDLANKNAQNITVYPNPSNGNFTLDLNQLIGQKAEMTVTNCLGQVINTKKDMFSSKMNIDLSGQEKGIYFIEIKSEDQSVSRGKIVLQ